MASSATLAAEVAREGVFFDAAMHPRLFKSFERSRLGMSQARLDASLREGPVSTAGPNQQEFDPTSPESITHRRYLFTPAQFSKLRK